MFDKRTEQQVNIKFFMKLKKTATEMFNLLHQVYGENALACVSEWCKRFSEERTWEMMNYLAVWQQKLMKMLKR
jgi:hypothetical protein